MSVLVTGGAGFVGSHLVEQLLRTTDQSIVILDNFNDFYDPRLKRAGVAPLVAQPRVKLIEVDKKTGKFRLSRKVLIPRPPKQEATTAQ